MLDDCKKDVVIKNSAESVAPLSRRKEKKKKRSAHVIRLVKGSADVMVQHTNDDSVVSKRSTVYHKYIEDPYLRFFVKKRSRRSPLIHRGYYLRMKAMTDIITRSLDYFLEISASKDSTPGTPVQVISLGAGYDTLAMRLLLNREGDQAVRTAYQQRAQFFDVDFPAVMQTKAALMQAAPPGSFPSDWRLEPGNGEFPVQSVCYRALGVDLRQAEQVLLKQLHRSCDNFSTDHPTVIYAECMMQYMPPENSTALVRFISHNFPNAIFIAYDQLHPADSFGKVMQHSLQQKNSPLLGVEAFPNGAAMMERARQCGMEKVAFANFYDLSRYYISGAERARVDGLEPFDEMEEWSEMCEHYGITMGVTSSSAADYCGAHPAFKTMSALKDCSCEAAGSAGDAAVAVRGRPWPSGRFGFEGWGNGSVYAETAADGDVVLVGYGGFAVSRGHQRVSSVFCHGLREGERMVTNAGDLVSQSADGHEAGPPALVLHSFLRLAPYCYVVFGGRTNPTTVSGDAFLMQLSAPTTFGGQCSVRATWARLGAAAEEQQRESLKAPVARYRHAAVAISASEVFIFGGRDAAGQLLGDAWLATVDVDRKVVGYAEVSLSGDVPPPLCSSATVCVNQDEVLLSGGLMACERCTDALWHVNVRRGTCQRMPCGPIGARFSHTLTPVQVNGEDCLLVLGGSSTEPKVSVSPQAALLSRSDGRYHVQPIALSSDCPSWSRHACVAVSPGVVAVIGGGYTCFSFGTFAAKPMLLYLGNTPYGSERWTRRPANVSRGADGEAGPAVPLATLLSLPRRVLPETSYSPEAFLHVVRCASHPALFRKVNIGMCVERWGDPAYLMEAEGAAVVSAHVAPGSHLLDFVRKNFTFRHMPFKDLIRHTMEATRQYQETRTLPEEVLYYRSVATHMKTDRANIWSDFRTLGKDFCLPDGVKEFVTPRIHQSCLRINAPPLQLWTHYDGLDNVLIQVVGRKRVVLFPPHQYNNLYMSGSSSLVVNLDSPDIVQYPRFISACEGAVEVILNPGDMLYFPALWFHHITTLDDDYSISVNVFFEHFEASEYDQKDLYGNKDLPCAAQLRQQIVSHATQLVQNARLTSSNEPVPSVYTEFALRQAIQDLERLADRMAVSHQKAMK